MTDYVKSTNFTSKDSLATGNPLKIIKGSEFDTEFNAIATAVASKADVSSPALSGTPTTPTPATGTSNTQIASTAFVAATVNAAVVTGEIKLWPTSSAPTGYLACNGAAISRTVYSALYAVLGTTFGSGDGSTTFNLPDYRNRMPIGSGGLYSNGNTGGSKDAVVVAHTHTGTTNSDGLHSHTLPAYPNNPLQAGTRDTASAYQSGTQSTSTAGAHTHSFTTASTGVSGTDANLPPYLAINFIIKT